MAVVAATIQSVECVEGPHSSIAHATTGHRLTYRLGLNVGGGVTAMTAGDTAAVVTAGSKLALVTKNGKSVTIQQAAGCGPGLTPGGTAAYFIIPTVDGTTLAFSVGGPTAAAAAAAGTIVHAYVTVDEV
jgi:hypothetical protein